VVNRWLLDHRTSILAVLALVMAAYAAGHWVGHSASQCMVAGEKNRFGYRTWYLGADLGGTNFRVQLYMVGAGQLREGRLGRAVFTRKYVNLDHGGDVEAMLRNFLAEAAARGNATHGVDGAAISIAGPVRRNVCAMTNLAQTVDGDALAKAFDIPGGVTLINDFVAAGYGALTLQPSEYVNLQEGETDERAPISLLGAGTGLGQCFVTRDLEGRPTSWGSEGGHAEWAPRTPLEFELSQWMMAKYTSEGSARRISLERVISGNGLSDIYEFLATQKYPERANPAVLQRFREARFDKRPVVVSQAASAETIPGNSQGSFDELCGMAMDIFMLAYGSEVGATALRYLPAGGLYIGGGLAPKHRAWIEKNNSLFMKGFLDKGRMSKVVTRIPLRLVLVEDIGERGAQLVAMQAVRRAAGVEESVGGQRLVARDPIMPVDDS